jgi:quinol monooxygenase YgiN
MPDIVILGELEFVAGHSELWLSHAAELVQATNKEGGCRRYRICASPHSPDGVLFFEWYENADALAAHMASPHFAAFREATSACRLRNSKIDRFEASRID